MTDDSQRRLKYETFARFTEAGLSFTEQNGRYPAQAAAEKLIFADIQSKLRLRPEDRLLDAGCGMGNTLIPASFVVGEAVGLDHPAVIAALEKTFGKENCTFHGGDFLSYQPSRPFSKILIYNVFSALPDRETAQAFVEKGLSLLSPGGLMLIGDIPNADKKSRFAACQRGQSFAKEWGRQMAAMPPAPVTDGRSSTLPSFTGNDEYLFKLCHDIRSKGFDAWILPQPQGLPFGNTREDLLIAGPEYQDGSMDKLP